jgi:hypothetical protein
MQFSTYFLPNQSVQRWTLQYRSTVPLLALASELFPVEVHGDLCHYEQFYANDILKR